MQERVIEQQHLHTAFARQETALVTGMLFLIADTVKATEVLEEETVVESGG